MEQSAFNIFPPQASEFAPKYDLLYYFLTAVSVFFSVLIFALIAFFCFKYRRRREDEVPKPTVESHRLELFYTVVPFLIVMVMFFWGARLYFVVYKETPDALVDVGDRGVVVPVALATIEVAEALALRETLVLVPGSWGGCVP